MPQRRLIYCGQCGGVKLSGTQEFLVFHCLEFCFADCRDDERREKRPATRLKPARAA